MTDIAARTATPGGAYYPEMGETHDGTALFQAHYSLRSMAVQWSPGRHDAALVAFRAHRIRPRCMTLYTAPERISGKAAWSALVTFAAADKLRAAKLMVTELLLD